MAQYLEGDVWSMERFAKCGLFRTLTYADEDHLGEGVGGMEGAKSF